MNKLKRAAIIILLLFGANVAIGQDGKGDYKLGKSMEILMNIFKEVNLYYVDSVDSEKLLKYAADAMLSKLDPYTVYLPSDEMEDFETLTTGKYAGVGALIRQRGQWIEISEPYKNTPADKAGLKAGDRLVEIDGLSLKGLTSEKVSSMLRGEAGSTFKLKYAPLTDTLAVKEVTIKREQIASPSVDYYGYVKEGIGYIRLNGFIEDCSIEVRDALNALRKKGKLTGLILDLRDNSGGSVSEAVKIASFFVPKGTEIVALKGKIKEFDTKYVTKTAPIEADLPLVIIQNSSSASASEILAGALQDMDRAVILGQRSYGKGLVQTPKPIGYDSYLKVTTAKYYIPSGRSVQALDYTHRKEDGSVGHIPDSLIKEFRTAAGRKVYSGGGVQPDIKTENEYFSKFTSILLAYGFIDDFTNTYAVFNPVVAVDEFRVDDRIYDQFVEFMRNKEIEYESGTSVMLKELKKWADREKFEDRLQEEIASIERKIKEDKMEELKTFKSEISQVLTESIILKWYYNSGRVEYTVKNNDPDVKKSEEILMNPAQMQHILKQQDTDRE